MGLPVIADETLAVTVSNLALMRIGVSKTISTLSDASREGMTASVHWDHVFRSCLRTFPWPFATKYLDLTVHTGTVAVPVNGDWTFSYTYPDDCLFARRIVTANARKFQPAPVPFRIGREGNDKVLYTDCDAAELEYTAIFDCPVALADELFIEAAAWLMAAQMAPSLSKMTEMHTKAFTMYRLTLEQAAVVSSREDQHEPNGEAEWIRAR